MKEQNSSPEPTDEEEDDDSLQGIAKEELGETEQAKEEGIAAIKDWITTQDNQAYTQLGAVFSYLLLKFKIQLFAYFIVSRRLVYCVVPESKQIRCGENKIVFG